MKRRSGSWAEYLRSAQLRAWVWNVANQRIHGTTHEKVITRWEADQFQLQECSARPAYPYADDELRKVARDAYVSWQASRYSAPWRHAGKEVWVRECGAEIEILHGSERVAIDRKAEEPASGGDPSRAS